MLFFVIHLCYKSSSRSKNCGGRLIKPKGVDDKRHFKTKGTHRHAPDVRVIGKKKVMHAIKTKAKGTTESARDIIADSMVNVQSATAATIPGPSQLVRNINRIRHDPNAPKNPKTLAELYFPEKYTKTSNDKAFLLFDSGIPEDEEDFRIVMFGTQENMDFLVRCEGVYMDGTFWITPALFSQLYTIHGENYKIYTIRHNII